MLQPRLRHIARRAMQAAILAVGILAAPDRTLAAGARRQFAHVRPSRRQRRPSPQPSRRQRRPPPRPPRQRQPPPPRPPGQRQPPPLTAGSGNRVSGSARQAAPAPPSIPAGHREHRSGHRLRRPGRATAASTATAVTSAVTSAAAPLRPGRDSARRPARHSPASHRERGLSDLVRLPRQPPLRASRSNRGYLGGHVSDGARHPGRPRTDHPRTDHPVGPGSPAASAAVPATAPVISTVTNTSARPSPASPAP